MIEAAKIQSLVKRITNLMDERDGTLADIRDIYTEAKSHEIVPKVLRKVIARQRAKDPAALILEDDLLETYLAALDGPTRRAVDMAARGATARAIEAETGIDHATVARSVSLKKKRATKSTTELTETQEIGGDPPVVVSQQEPSQEGAPPAPHADSEGEIAVRSTPAASIPEIDLTIPAHLKRERVHT